VQSSSSIDRLYFIPEIYHGREQYPRGSLFERLCGNGIIKQDDPNENFKEDSRAPISVNRKKSAIKVINV